MGKDILDSIYKWLVTIFIIIAVVFVVFIFSHGAIILYEFVFQKDKSEKRWKEIREKFEHKKPVDKPNTYIIPFSGFLSSPYLGGLVGSP